MHAGKPQKLLFSDVIDPLNLFNFQVTLVRSRDKLENVFRHFLIEDRGTNGAPSYVDYLCYLHKEIRSLLS